MKDNRQHIVLIITSRSEITAAWKEREQYVKDFCSLVENKLASTRVLYTTYSDLEYLVKDDATSIFDVHNELDLKDVDIVHFKNWTYDADEAAVIAGYLKRYEIPFYNSEVLLASSQGKLAQMFVLASNGVKVPDTFYTSKVRLKDYYFSQETLPTGFQYPLIMKANDGSRGDDNHLIKNAEEAIDVLTASDPEKQYVLQNFIPNDGDFRVLFAGFDAQPLIFHRKGATGSHLNNTSKGGEGKFMHLADVPGDYLSQARMAAELLNREIGGVDILVDKTTGKPYILEVNGTPALATGYGVETKAQFFADFIDQIIEVMEEE